MTVELLHMDCMDFLREQEDETYDLIIADPPYFEVKGSFDFKWDSFEAYLSDVEIWAKEMSRVLKGSGSMLWYGHAKKIAYSQVILDKYFNLENSMTWEKKDSMQYQYYSSDLARSFNTHTERILYYSKEIEMTGREFIETEFIAPRNPFSIYLSSEFKLAKVSNKSIASLFPSKTGGVTGCVSNWLNGNNVITEEQYLIIRAHLNGEYLRKEYEYLRKEYEYLRKEYEELRKEYEELRRPFNNDHKLTDILTFSQEGSETGRHKHPTQKPPKLTRALVHVIGKKGGKAFIPFMGSGVEAIECANFGMDVDATELDADYYDAACKRFKQMTAQVAMF
ncbi:MAG: DNA methyltransferase [Desulfobacterales bacterium]